MAIPGFDQAMQALSDGQRRVAEDADETRRLLYMAIVAPHCKRYNLAGTLINALRHHHGIDPPGLEATVVSLINDDSEADAAWARERIDALTKITSGSDAPS